MARDSPEMLAQLSAAGKGGRYMPKTGLLGEILCGHRASQTQEVTDNCFRGLETILLYRTFSKALKLVVSLFEPLVARTTKKLELLINSYLFLVKSKTIPENHGPKRHPHGRERSNHRVHLGTVMLLSPLPELKFSELNHPTPPL